ncbi:hypothetical protein ACFTZI_00030 [Streptomyces decoyicus]|uniref:hypothetical protein n=1 Tax=Streptomyces decoyicus TaxID=249567 RepID=UPI00363BB243
MRDLARRSHGFSHHTYGAVLRGDRPVTTDILLAMLQACSVDPGPAKRWLTELAHVRPGEELRVRAVLSKYRVRRHVRNSPDSGFFPSADDQQFRQRVDELAARSAAEQLRLASRLAYVEAAGPR